MFSTFDCAVKGYRQKEDPWNAILSGFLTGGCLAARGECKRVARFLRFIHVWAANLRWTQVDRKPPLVVLLDVLSSWACLRELVCLWAECLRSRYHNFLVRSILTLFKCGDSQKNSCLLDCAIVPEAAPAPAVGGA